MTRFNRNKFRSTVRGDTIVEVLISMAVLGGALGISYTVANNTLNQSRDAQERTQVVNLLDAQLEQLRAIASLPNTPVFTFTGAACFDSSGAMHSVPNVSNFATYPSACVQGYYHYYITRTSTGGADTYTATCKWDNVMGTGRDNVQIVYRMNKPS